jgi:hypothetical protein
MNSTPRRAVGTLRIVAALVVFATIATQITDRILNDAFDPEEYFSYFTIQSGLINIVVFVVGGVMALRLPRDTVLFTSVRAATLAYAVVTAGVYNLLLRGIPYEGFVGLQWPNEVLHVWIPIVIVLDWLLSPGRPALPWSTLRLAVVFPIAWLVYTLLRGAVTEIYPYPFIDPATAGWGSVVVYIVALSAVIVGLVALAVAYSRWLSARRPSSGSTRRAR